jgi:hypothetical protein
MKYILILLLSLNCFAEKFICLVDSNDKASNVMIDSTANRATLNAIKGQRQIKSFIADKIPLFTNKLWSGFTVTNDGLTDTQDLLDKKDFNKAVDEFLKCCFYVLLDYQNNDIKTKTNAQFKDDVLEKYNNRNPK